MIDYERISSAYITINGIQVPVLKIFETVDGQHKEVYSSGPFIPATVIYNANGGTFEDGSITNVVEYTKTKQKGTVTKISKTSNVSENGLAADTTNGYGNNQSTTDVITISGAESLDITITYQTESTSYDWVCIYDKNTTPSQSNYSDSISGKLGGSNKTKRTFTINGDTAKFYFRSDGYACGYYGYYATITGYGNTMVVNLISGEEKVPTHNENIFSGWYLDQECTDGNELDLNKVVKSGKVVTVYARWITKEEQNLITDFYYTKNNDGTYTIINWKGTYQGEPSTELIIPDFSKIIL